MPNDFTRQVESAATQWVNNNTLFGMHDHFGYGVLFSSLIP
jgi:hypothetical protein